MEDVRLNHLLSLYVDGTLTAADKVELEQVLKESAEARRCFWDYTTLHALAHEAAKLKWAETPLVVAQALPASRSRRPWAGWKLPFLWPVRGGSWSWGLAIAGVDVLVAACLFWAWYPNRGIAVLTKAVGAEWASGTNGPATDAVLAPGWLHLKRGAVQVTFNSEATVLFEAPAEFQLVSPTEAFCRLGRFRVHAPEAARGFKLSLAGLEVVDLGTEFGLRVPPTGSPEVHVFAGRVDLTQTGAATHTLELFEGEAVRVEPDVFSWIPASHAGFLNEVSLARRSLARVRQRHEAWNKASRALTADPAAILHYTFEAEPFWARRLTNQVIKAFAETHGEIMGCEWNEGRWAGKRALEFKRSTDRVRLNLPNPSTSVTCLAWVRVDALPNGFVHSLMTGDSEGPGTLRWTISQQGNLRLGIANKSTGPQATWAVGISPPVVTKERLGRWLLLAVTYNGKDVSHYLDGQQVWTGPVAGPGTLNCGWIELGNWVATPEHPDFHWAKGQAESFFNRSFGGRMDEVAVLSRVLSASEIQQFYEAGRPLTPMVVARKDTVPKESSPSGKEKLNR